MVLILQVELMSKMTLHPISSGPSLGSAALFLVDLIPVAGSRLPSFCTSEKCGLSLMSRGRMTRPALTLAF